MSQARGRDTRAILYDEDTYGNDPGTPSGVLVHFTGFTPKSQQSLEDDNTLGSSRLRNRPARGNIDVNGDLSMNQSAEDMGKPLKHLLGSVSTFRPTVVQPTNITGVTVNRAESTCDTGDGTLTFTATGTTLAWQANGDTAGTAVDVSGGGDFTLESGTADNALYVTVTAGSLPGTDQADSNIAVADAYEHELTVGDLPAGLTADKDFGSALTSDRYEKANGIRIANGRFSFPQSGYCTAKFGLMGCVTTLADNPLDATPDDPGHTSFSAFSGSIEEGGSTSAVIKSLDITHDNDLDNGQYVIGGGPGGAGTRSDIPEGYATASGSISARFVDSTMLSKAINGTESSIKATLSRGTGDGTAGNEYISYELPQLEYERTSPDISGPRGIDVSLNFKSYAQGMKVILRNQLETL